MRHKINLFPPKEQSFVDKLIYFSFNYLRYILVITQLVVIGVFMYRFRYDQEIIDLKDAIQNKQEIVKVAQYLFEEAEQSENKIKGINTALTNQSTFNEMVSYYLNIFPEGISATKLDIQKNTIEFEGVTKDISVLQAFYVRLQTDQRFKVVDIRNLKKKDNGFTFSFTLSNYVPPKT